MERTGLQRTWVRILLTVLTLATMGMIFLFSTENAEKSDETSGYITKQVIDVLHPDYAKYELKKQKSLYDSIQTVIRKMAHYTEFALLGFLMRLCLESWFGRRKWLSPASWALSTLYAGSDELHQILIDGRSGQWTDILLDSAGVLSGVLLAVLILFLVRKRATRKETSEICP
jgi:VanZ family protein